MKADNVLKDHRQSQEHRALEMLHEFSPSYCTVEMEDSCFLCLELFFKSSQHSKSVPGLHTMMILLGLRFSRKISQLHYM